MQNLAAPSDSDRRTLLARLPGRVILIGMLIAAPWMLGAVAGWAQTLLCLCGLTALAFWWLEIAILRPKQIVIPLSVIPILLGIGLGVVQFLPLPDSVAQNLGAGHAYQQWENLSTPVPMDEEMAELLALNSGADPDELLRPATRSISIDPNATRMMTAQLVMAALCYLLGAHFFHDRRSLTWLCVFLTLNGVALSLFGIVQKLSGTPGMIYGFIPVRGMVFGPYVNRNIASGLLVMCLAAAIMLTVRLFQEGSSSSHHYRRDWWKSFLHVVHELDAKKIAAVSAVIFIVAGVIASLSRGGTLSVLAGLLVASLMMGIHNRNSRSSNRSLIFLGMALTLGLGLVAWLGFGEQILERFEDAERSENARVENWRDTMSLIPEQWLLGSGLHTYQHVHRPYRSSPERYLFVFAENQFFQALLDGGIIGLGLLLGMLAWTIYYIQYLMRSRHSEFGFIVALLGGSALAAETVSASFDFGLYIPANTLTFAVLMGAIAGFGQAEACRGSRRFRLATLGWGKLGIVLLLILFSAGMLSLYEFYHRSQLESVCLAARNLVEQQRDADLDEVNSTLGQLGQLAEQRRDAEVEKAMAQLLLLQFRLEQFQTLAGEQQLTDPMANQIWNQTNPVTSHVYIQQQKEIAAERGATLERNFRSNQALKAAVLPAYAALMTGRSVSPMDPEFHLRLAELGAVLTDQSPVPHLDRAVGIAPTNDGYQMMAGVLQLQHAHFDPAHPEFEPGMGHLRTAIELNPGMVGRVQQLVVRQNVLGTWVFGLDHADYAEEILLSQQQPQPQALYQLIRNNPYFQENPDKRDRLIRGLLAHFETDDFLTTQKLEARELEALAELSALVGDWQRTRQFADSARRKLPSSKRPQELLEQAEAELQSSGNLEQ